MGLKYEVFMIKGSADNLHTKILSKFEGKIRDTSDMSRREREWYLRPMPITDNIEKFMEELDPRDPELEAWMKDGRQTGFHIWWMDHPTRKGIVVGGYTNHWLHDAEYTSVFCGVLIKCGIEEVLIQSYHHGVNDGHIQKIRLADPVGVEDYPSLKDEEEKWGKYAKRINKICGYPVLAWHHYISNPKIHLVPWKYSVMTVKKTEQAGASK
jgi:hypothetical protein